MKVSTVKALILFGAAIYFAGCSEGGKLNLMNPIPQASLKATPGSEFVSAAANFQPSAGNTGVGIYKVQHSVGNFTSKMQQVSTPSGYRVFHSVQGAMISDEL